MYKYKLKNMEASSVKYGNCEVCKEHVSEVFYQSEQKQYKGIEGIGWTFYKCFDYFGHKECLESKQRN